MTRTRIITALLAWTLLVAPPAAGAEAADRVQAGAPPQARIAPPSRTHGSTVARIVAARTARRRPGHGRRIWRVGPATTWASKPQALLVLDSAVYRGHRYVKVLLPIRPNGRAGWISRDAVTLARSRYWIDVRTSRRLVTVYRDGRRVRRFRAVVGAPGTPTPHTLAAIYERNRQPDPRAFLGTWSLALTALSTVLENYGGGPGRVAIHGRAGQSLRDPLGTARSHGCVRVDNRNVSWMATRVPAGTPVRLRS